MAADQTPKTSTPVPEDTPTVRGVSAVWGEALAMTVWVWIAGWLPRMADILHASNEYGGWSLPPAELIVSYMSPWWMALGGAAVAFVLAVIAGRWAPHNLDGHVRLYGLVVGACVSGWLVWAGFTSPVEVGAYLIVGAVVLGTGWWALNNAADRAAIPAPAPVTPGQPAPPESEHALMHRMLDRSNNGDVIIVDFKETRSGQSWLLGPRTHHPDTGEPLDDMPGYDDFTTRLKPLTMHVQALWRGRGVEFIDNDIRPEPVKVDRWWLHINTRHVEKEEVKPDAKPAELRRKSWNAPAWLGLFLDGADILMSLCGIHVKGVGATGGGKSVMANNAIREALTTEDLSMPPGHRDCHVFICATTKLMPIAWPWVKRWFTGSMRHPAIEWIAGEDPERVLNMMAAVYRLAVARNAQLGDDDKHLASHRFPGLLVIWEEARHGGNTENFHVVNGQEWTISRYVMEIVAIARSAAIGIWALTQDGTVDGIGPYGSDASRNFTGRYVTVTENHSDATQNLPKLDGMGVDTTKLMDNTIYVQMSLRDDSRAFPAKASHIAKSPIIEPLVMAEVAHLIPPVWTPEDLAALGDDYAQRWDPDALPEVYAHCARQNIPWPTLAPAQVAAQPAVAAGGGVATMAPPAQPAQPVQPAPSRLPSSVPAYTPATDDPMDAALFMLAKQNGLDPNAIVSAYHDGTLDDSVVELARTVVAGLGGRPDQGGGGGGDTPDEGGAHPGDSGDHGGMDPVEQELQQMLAAERGGAPAAPAVVDEAPAADTGGKFGLVSPERLGSLDDMAAAMQRWADEQFGPEDGGGQADDVDDASVATASRLPSPMREVMAALDMLTEAHGGPLAWVATAQIAGIVKGDDGAEAARRMGREIVAALGNDETGAPILTTTDPRHYGPGRTRRGNGFKVADLTAAVQRRYGHL